MLTAVVAELEQSTPARYEALMRISNSYPAPVRTPRTCSKSWCTSSGR